MKIETYQKSPDNENSYSAIFDSIDLLIHIFFIMVIFIIAIFITVKQRLLFPFHLYYQ